MPVRLNNVAHRCGEILFLDRAAGSLSASSAADPGADSSTSTSTSRGSSSGRRSESVATDMLSSVHRGYESLAPSLSSARGQQHRLPSLVLRRDLGQIGLGVLTPVRSDIGTGGRVIL